MRWLPRIAVLTSNPEPYASWAGSSPTAVLRGYAIDAILEEHPRCKPLTRLDAVHRLQTLASDAVLTRQPVPGVGEYFTVRGPGVAGGIARHRGRVVHAALFPSASQ